MVNKEDTTAGPRPNPGSGATIARQTTLYFEYLKSIGIEYVEPAFYDPEAFAAEKETELEALSKEVAACSKCPLYKGRTRAVFGTGSQNATLMFVGEAPGAEEDRQGKPFVGRAGKLLTKMIQAMGFAREEVYIANVLKSRPPGNRDPLPNEAAACEPYLIRQIGIIKPAVICALGAHAAKTLLKTSEPIGRLRGRFHDYHGTPLMVIYHPAFLLRSPAYKKEAWKDLQILRNEHNKIVKR
jgi:DNA polymerase